MSRPGRRAPSRRRAGRGFVLLPVALLLGLIAAVAFMGNRETALSSAMSSGSESADKARLAAEAGLQRAIVQMHGKGCGGTYPVPILSPVKDTAFDGATYSASAWPVSGSPVTITSVGTHGDASVTLTRTNVPMHQASPVTMTLQPGAEGLDTQITSGSAASNGGLATMALASGTSHGLLRFDLSSLPAGAHVTSATLSAYATAGSNTGAVSLHRVMRDWTEAATWSTSDGATAWSQAGADAHGTAVASASFTGAGTWLSWNVTTLADRWLKGGLPNQGVQIRVGAAGVSGLQLATGDASGATQRPKLAVTFLPPCGWTPPSTTVTLTPTADTDIDNGPGGVTNTNFGAAPDLYLSKGVEARPLLKFDVSGIAAGKVVLSANLRLYLSSMKVSGAPATQTSVPLTVNVHRVSNPWNELQATWMRRVTGTNWTSQGGDYVTPAATTRVLAANTPTGAWQEFSVTSTVQSWIDGVTPNNGVILVLPTSSTEELIFDSREAASRPPELVVTYK